MSKNLSFDAIIQRNSGVILPPKFADNMARWLIDQDRDKFTVDEIAAGTDSEHVVGHVYHPAFIRAAARRGSSFYIDSKGNIRRQRIKGVIKEYLEPLVDGEADPNFYLTPKWIEPLEKFIEQGQNVLMIGPAGCGKTTAAEQIFKRREQELLVVSCTASMCADDFEGTIELINGETIFSPAAPAIASEKGYGLLLDEMDAAPPESCYSLYRLLAGSDMHIIRKGMNSRIPRHEDLRILGTQNTEGRGDPMGLHHGRAFQDEAMLDRWGSTLRIEYPSVSDEKLILRRRTALPEEHCARIADAAALLRKATNSSKLMFCMTMRRSYIVALNIASGYSPLAAWEYAVLNRVTAEDRRAALEILQRVYANKFNKRTSLGGR